MADSLFEIDAPQNTVPLQHLPITDEQVGQLRAAFAEAGIHEQHERKALIESFMVRPVSSLRDLYATDAHRLLNLLRQRKTVQPKKVGGSAWDNREEETWIDKL
ncbi:hypothetical protein Asphe3_41540 (plasmid) [Pseudarthrobacter phenanthrenivorans Sphe3]|uniref:Uncharacterized protein n=1 Tax=Pseudarthrobacter phenanthrenivorans (strain DSM 18606 / JCM 16027 / LMG 23796 / Sphe3) TaxID=930171 RepID=F0MCG8_PSEPM|nr:hypothetical protein [Pseudarthrobacter phenanthrenivorans]ADX75219.1 hypothetical protein Asphe3_41540 [Pseudarthrobacter phenanthrenivorans Sphe3]